MIGVQQSYLMENVIGNTNEFGLSSEEEDDVEAIENSDAEDNENIDLSDGYGSDVHEELNIILKSDLDINDDGAGLTIISDMQKELHSAIKELLLEYEQRMCNVELYYLRRRR
ncbi:hypothetical protein K7X08_003362 [Anisodus acutangulus]|uniref:Uncharacterized protein n=1 Tax=Anisodus acutangulus TaxID=402998 RepID=A0A9Q1RJ26_9SOLA|nr:hypothetical protein K7X08_003362 [Anisodus acutangulus]